MKVWKSGILVVCIARSSGCQTIFSPMAAAASTFLKLPIILRLSRLVQELNEQVQRKAAQGFSLSAMNAGCLSHTNKQWQYAEESALSCHLQQAALEAPWSSP